MAPRNGPGDDTAVTPVVGIILMVAITVLLASVIAAFSFTLFDRDTNPAPAVSFTETYDETADTLAIVHDGGSKFDNVTVSVQFANGTAVPQASSWPSTVQAGDELTLSEVAPDDEVQVIWEDPRADDQTQIIGEWTGPEA